MAGEPGEQNPQPRDAEDVILDNVRRLIGSRADETMVVHVGLDANVPTEDMLEIARRTQKLPLASAGAGDVVWWKTASGTTGYFAIEQPYTNDRSGDVGGMESGNGRFLITRREGHRLGDQRESGYILGATLGGGLMKDVIAKGAQLEYEIERDGVKKKYTSTPVTEMGVVKAQQARSEARPGGIRQNLQRAVARFKLR
jgi:hypothetical protein